MWTDECTKIAEEIKTKTGEEVTLNVCKFWHGKPGQDIGQDIDYIPGTDFKKDYAGALKKLKIKLKI